MSYHTHVKHNSLCLTVPNTQYYARIVCTAFAIVVIHVISYNRAVPPDQLGLGKNVWIIESSDNRGYFVSIMHGPS